MSSESTRQNLDSTLTGEQTHDGLMTMEMSTQAALQNMMRFHEHERPVQDMDLIKGSGPGDFDKATADQAQYASNNSCVSSSPFEVSSSQQVPSDSEI